MHYVLTPEQANFSYAVSSDTVQFTNGVTGVTSCFWDFGDGNTSTSCNPVHVFAPGTYTVCFTMNSASCTNLTSCQVVTVTSTGMLEQNVLNNVHISPNPASNKIRIQPGGRSAGQQISISVINLVGTEMLNSVLDMGNEKMEMDLSSLSSGIYFVKLKMGADVVTKKLILSKE